jgi:hypothetical protein
MWLGGAGAVLFDLFLHTKYSESPKIEAKKTPTKLPAMIRISTTDNPASSSALASVLNLRLLRLLEVTVRGLE